MLKKHTTRKAGKVKAFRHLTCDKEAEDAYLFMYAIVNEHCRKHKLPLVNKTEFTSAFIMTTSVERLFDVIFLYLRKNSNVKKGDKLGELAQRMRLMESNGQHYVVRKGGE